MTVVIRNADPRRYQAPFAYPYLFRRPNGTVSPKTRAVANFDYAFRKNVRGDNKLARRVDRDVVAYDKPAAIAPEHPYPVWPGSEPATDTRRIRQQDLSPVPAPQFPGKCDPRISFDTH